MASASILAFVEGAEKKVDALHSLMVLRHGQVVAEGWWGPYQRQDPHVLYSLSKSFASTGIGLAIAEGKLSLDDTVISLFSELAPARPSPNLEQMRVRDLLSMSTGHHADVLEGFPYADPEKDAVREFLALPVAHKPGTHFVYNTPASFMLSAIVQKVSGQPLVDYLGPRLFEPLGISGAKWDQTPKGVSMGGFGLHLRTEDIARFGQLLLQKGQWNGKTVLPSSWVELATSRQVSNGSNPASDWDQGYGYQFWRCRNGAYRGDGAFGQYCIVMPQQDAVVAITSGLGDMQAVLNLAWGHLQPAMKPEALPADAAAQAKLQQKLATLTLTPQSGQATSPVAREVSGKLFELPKNDDGIEAIGLEVAAGGTTLVLRASGREYRVPCGSNGWKRGGTYPHALRVSAGPGGGQVEQKVAASGAWTTEDTYTVKACLHETPYCNTLRLFFTGRALVLDQQMNVGFGPTQRPQLVARPLSAPKLTPSVASR
jgi:CubicO group peptidase (beta-lactamase class C family)